MPNSKNKVEQMTYRVRKSNEPAFAYEVTAQRGDNAPQLSSRLPVAHHSPLAGAIGNAVILAMRSKHDYGNKHVQVIIEPNICSIVEPKIKI